MADHHGLDLLLVLAVDCSYSISAEEAALQREGHRAALRHDLVLRAIRNGARGAIGVAYVAWAGFEFQRLLLPWTRIADEADALAWGRRLAAAAAGVSADATAAAYPSYPATSLSGGIAFAHRVMVECPWSAARRVIDVCGDGPNNDGPPVEPARDRAVADGITINGLAIEGDGDVERELGPGATLEAYYRDSVIGGPDAFVVAADGITAFGAAIRRKLVLEITRGAPDRAAG